MISLRRERDEQNAYIRRGRGHAVYSRAFVLAGAQIGGVGGTGALPK